jgi:hypothetical protein
MQVKDYQTGNQFIYYFGRCRGAESRTEQFMDKLVLGAAALALSAGAASAQALYPSNGYGPYGYGYRAPAPLYDYAGPASATPHGYGPLIYTPQLYAPTPAFPTPPAEPGYYTAQSVVVSQPLYDYAPDVNRAHKGSKLTPDPAAMIRD